MTPQEHMEYQRWVAALRGLCVGSEKNLLTPEQCASNVRSRLRRMGDLNGPPTYVIDLVAASGRALEQGDHLASMPGVFDELRRCYHGALQLMPSDRLSKLNWMEAMQGEDDN